MEESIPLPLTDVLIYIFIPGPIVLLYPLLVATMLQSSIQSPVGKSCLIGISVIVNLVISPFLVPVAIMTGFLLSSILIPILLSLYGLTLANRLFGDDFVLHKYINVLDKYIPRFGPNAEHNETVISESYLTESCLSEDLAGCH